MACLHIALLFELKVWTRGGFPASLAVRKNSEKDDAIFPSLYMLFTGLRQSYRINS